MAMVLLGQRQDVVLLLLHMLGLLGLLGLLQLLPMLRLTSKVMLLGLNMSQRLDLLLHKGQWALLLQRLGLPRLLLWHVTG